ncbi:MAG: hypothetical protein OIF38_10325 [Cellvibrionaceae bacterium]|nr:hypothetical protein [Cellvibrionaceae bacterium]
MRLLSLMAVILLGACSTVTIDEYQRSEAQLGAGERVVVLGRRHSPEYETEPDLISCVGKIVGAGNKIEVIDEQQFMDQLYPWFEPRMAPLALSRLGQLKQKPALAKKLNKLGIRYFIWVDGSTRTVDSSANISCAIGPGGGGCFGFGVWDDKSDYEATVWDYQNQQLVAKISADASGTSYMPAVVVPIPLLARVQSNACKALGGKLRQVFSPETSGAE